MKAETQTAWGLSVVIDENYSQICLTGFICLL